MKNNISLLVGLKNNLEYSKHFYKTARKLYPDVEICFVSYGSTDNTHEWLDSLEDPNLKYFHSQQSKTFSDTFNKAAELSTKDYVAYLHNDIVLAPNFLENLQKHLDYNNVVSYTTIEPPIFAGHERPGKIIYDLGTDLDSLDLDSLYQYVLNIQTKYTDRTEPGITFFMCMPRIKLLEIGGLDNLFNPMFCEDDDLIQRWQMLGMNCFTSLDSICYHFVSKTSRFSEEYVNKTQQIEQYSNRNFIRKWGFRQSQNKYKYNVAFVMHNSSPSLIELLEPWCDRLYVDNNMQVIVDNYIQKEQLNTKFDLRKRLFCIGFNDPIAENDIVLEFNATQLTQQSFNIIQQLSDIITESGEIGTFELDCFKITINSMNRHEKDLIICNIF